MARVADIPARVVETGADVVDTVLEVVTLPATFVRSVRLGARQEKDRYIAALKGRGRLPNPAGSVKAVVDAALEAPLEVVRNTNTRIRKIL